MFFQRADDMILCDCSLLCLFCGIIFIMNKSPSTSHLSSVSYNFYVFITFLVIIRNNIQMEGEHVNNLQMFKLVVSPALFDWIYKNFDEK